MERITAKSGRARRAGSLVVRLQEEFAASLDELADELGFCGTLNYTEWLRDGGAHGGGHRYHAADSEIFNRAAINCSHIHYDDDPQKALASADALSTIIHPKAAHAPSVHMHFSYTELREGGGYWRMMADLNPSIERPEHTEHFIEALKTAAPNEFDEAMAQGALYFDIPALQRTRGVAHFYLEGFNSGDFASDLETVEMLAESAMKTYVAILADALAEGTETHSEEEARAQLAYHTVYFFQVLTLDRGTTSGLLVHDQNDLGIMGSLPEWIDPNLLASFRSRVVEEQKNLVDRLVAIVGPGPKAHISDGKREKLATALRDFYEQHPSALELQARGDSLPPTVANHADRTES